MNGPFVTWARTEGGRRLAAAFERAREQGRAALVGYWMGGYPDAEASEAALLALARGGCDVLEVGVPFSDPVADGPVLQQAGAVALQAGAGFRRVLDVATAVQAAVPETPVVVMGYYNLFLQMELRTVAADLARRGLAGVIVPDLPVEEAGEMRAALAAHELAWISLAAPTSGDRLAALAEAGDGFIYAITHAGVTGVRDGVAPGARELVERLRRHTGLPVALGFGISGPQQAAAYRFAHGVVVGSAFVVRWMEAPTRRDALREVEALARALHEALVER
ncbi:MAG TPA: tryptophan synthase subunit alpha [Limnochordales bacterium]